jgi:hypothetical protein
MWISAHFARLEKNIRLLKNRLLLWAFIIFGYNCLSAFFQCFKFFYDEFLLYCLFWVHLLEIGKFLFIFMAFLFVIPRIGFEVAKSRTLWRYFFVWSNKAFFFRLYETFLISEKAQFIDQRVFHAIKLKCILLVNVLLFYWDWLTQNWYDL